MDLQQLVNDPDAFALLSPEQKAEMLRLAAEVARRNHAKKCDESFEYYAKSMWGTRFPFEMLWGHHLDEMAQAFEDIASGKLKRLIINMPPRHALLTTTPISTTEGWKTVEDVKVGDFVFGPDGKPTRVIRKTQVFKDVQLYDVTTNDGQTVTCDGDHLWTITNPDYGRRGAKATFDFTAAELFARQSRLIGANKSSKLPLNKAVEYPEKDLLVPPYVLGAWLGDGASTCGTMAACPTDAPHIRGRFEELGVPTTTTKWDMTFGTKGLMVKLREIGVLNNKHIPPEYLMASVEQRMELLRGLIDTDGDVTKDGKVTFNGSNRILVEGVLELLHSLGVKAQITERHTSYKGYETRLSFRIMFKLKGAASLPRKAERTKDMEGNKARTISVELGGRGDVQCIEVEREDGLFLAGKGYVLTHNCKSEATSWLFPSWMMGKNPNLKILHISHTDGLVSQFGGWVRDLIATPKYQSVYPSTKLKKDKKATGQWHTDKGGEYYGAGTGGAIAGHGGDLIIVDDPHSEQDTSDKAFEDASVWFQDGVRQREQAGAAIVLVMTRWSQRDLTASILAKAKETGEYWKVIEFPAMNEEGTEVLWPEKWSLNAMLMKKASLSVKSWTATYLQKPVAGEASIIKEEWWNNWNGDHLRSPSNKGGYPNFNYILQSWDCADTDGAKSNPSACTTWGIFDRYDPIQDQTVACAFLLDAFAKKMLWPELKKKARELYDLYKSDLVLIEAKSAGRALASELSMMGIPVMENKVTRSSGNKIVRVNQIADIFASGRVFAYTSHRYAQEVITEMSAFPHGLTDDLTDTVSQALSHMREGMMIGTENDRWGNSSDEDNKPRDRNVAYY